MTKHLIIPFLAILFLADCTLPLTDKQTGGGTSYLTGSWGPLDTTYFIEGQRVRLVEGVDITEVAPGGASKTITGVFGQLAYGDLDGNGEADAALILVQTGGGSGTFYYAAAALNVGGTWQGTNAVFLGDRIAPRNITIKENLIIVTYNDRLESQPMTAPPTVGVTRYIEMAGGKLTDFVNRGGNSEIEQGWVIIGHEVHSFQPCSEDRDFWLLGESPALPDIMAEYRQAANDSPPYRPILMTLAGIKTPRQKDGFGKDYEAGFLATELLNAAPGENCPNKRIQVNTPTSGARISSPLNVTGQARGTWFFEGDFPLVLRDARGRTVAEGYATAQGPWMTEEFVPFSGTLKFPERASNSWGWLIFKKANPSDRPELDDAVRIPVFFR